ncbi:hypothetical protein JS562_53615 [Agrobacterium sp. S2]|nr:hypothetical protein [Agrobacterium sp. S2]
MNDFLGRNRALDKLPSDRIRELFSTAIAALDEGGARDYVRPPRQRLNVATFDAVMIGAMRRVDVSGSLSKSDVQEAISTLRADQEFTTATSSQADTEENVRTRLRIATAAFAK